MSTDVPRVWVGCLACYNDGSLVGQWYEAAEAGDLTSEKVHLDAGRVGDALGTPDAFRWTPEDTEAAPLFDPEHEEIWVFDHENFGDLLSGECSPSRAAKLAQHLEEVDEWQRDAFIAWVGTGSHEEDGDGLPSISTFEDRYCGEWKNEEDYAQEFYDSTGDLPEEHPLCAYIDWERVARDMFMDYYTANAPGGIYVFRSY